MAGIGFALRRLSRRDDLLGILQGFAHSAMASAGPWVFTVVALGGIFVLGGQAAGYGGLHQFRLIIIYNFAFSLVLAGPLVMLMTRCLADRIYERDVEPAPGMLLGSLTLLFVAQLPIAGTFYFGFVELEASVRMAAVFNYFLISGIWLIGVFLTALKSYGSVSWAFALGMTASMVGAVLGASRGVASMLFGFNIGLGLIFFGLVARVFAEYPYPARRPWAFTAFLSKYWEIAAAGLVYNLSVWVDKWIMWTSPQAEVLPSRMVSFPDYDSAMFLAYLSIVPSIAVFVLSVETRFFEKYLRFYRDIRRHADWETIRANHRCIILDLAAAGRNFLVLQGSICMGLVLLAPWVFEILGVAFVQIGMFRMGLLGAVFHGSFLFMSIVLAYFDLRRAALYLQLLFLVSNGLFTTISLMAGYPYYGVGYCLASLLTALVAFMTVVHYLEDLPYQTFVAARK